MSAAVNAPAMIERRAERGRGKKLTVLQRLVAEDAAIEANELKKRRLVLWLLSLALLRWEQQQLCRLRSFGACVCSQH